jgi:hypothetical protein
LSREATAKAKAERDKQGRCCCACCGQAAGEGRILRLPRTGAKRPLWRLRASSCPPSAQILVLAGCFDRSNRVLTGLIAS